MRIACPGCKATYSIDDARIPATGLNMKCPRCSAIFAVRPPAAAASTGPVPLPGAAGHAAAPPPPPPSAGSVPLPGPSAAAPAAPHERSFDGAVPLPGGFGEAVPLPGASPFEPAPTPPFGSPFAAPVPFPGFGDEEVPADPFAAVSGGAPPPPPPPSSLPFDPAESFEAAPSEPAPFAPAPTVVTTSGGAAVPLPGADETRHLRGPATGAAGAVPLPGPGIYDRPYDFSQEEPISAPDLGFDFGSVDFDAPAPAPTPRAVPPPPPAPAEAFDFAEAEFDLPPPPAPAQQRPASTLEFDPTAATDGDLRAFLASDTPGPVAAASGSGRFHVRRPSGKTFGPFPEETVCRMLSDGQLSGSEEISLDGIAWTPLRENATFAASIPAEPPAGPSITPPVIGTPETTGSFEAKIKPPSAVEKASDWFRANRHRVGRKHVAAGAAVILLGAGAVQELATPYGFFFRNAILGYTGPEAGTPLARTLANASKELRRHTFASYQRAIAAAQQGLAEDPEDRLGRALQVQAVLLLAADFHESAAQVPQARSDLDALVATSRDDLEVRKARAALALLEGKGAEVAGLLGDVEHDAEGLYLLARGQVAAGKLTEAKGALAKLVALDPKSAPAIHLQGLVLRSEGDAAGARERFAAAFAADPQHALSAVELGEMALASRDAAEARTRLDAALSGTSAPGLGGSELARAWALLGTARARLRLADEAKAAFAKSMEIPAAGADARLRYATFLTDRRRFDEAVEILEKARAGSPDDPAVLGALIRAQVEAGKMLQADNLVKGLRKGQPDDPRLAVLQGVVAAAAGKSDEAVAAFQEALAKDAKSVEAHVELARVLAAAGKLPEARAEMRAAAELRPDDARVLAAQGDVRFAAGELDGALAAYDGAIRSDAEWLAAHLGRALVLEKKGDLAGARAAYETVLAINDAVPEHHLRYGSLLWKQKEMDLAIAALQKAHDLDPKNAPILSRLGAVQFEAGKVDDGIASIEGALALDNTNPETYLYLSRFQLAKGDANAAVHAIRRAIALDAANGAYAYQLGLIYEGANNPVEALEAFKKAAKLDPANADALEHQGTVLMALNAVDAAVVSFEAALARDPARTRLLLTIGDCHLKSNRWDKAIAALRRAGADSQLKGVNFRLGMAYQEKGKSADAIGYFQRAAQEDPSDAMPWRQLGYAYKERNRIGDAVQAFKRYLEKKPGADDKAEIEDEIATLRI